MRQTSWWQVGRRMAVDVDAVEAAAPHHVATVRRLVLDALTPEEFATLGRLSTCILDHMDDVQG